MVTTPFPPTGGQAQPNETPARAGFRVVPANPGTTPQRRAEILADPGFGRFFTDHMAQISWTREGGWQDPRVLPYGPLSLDPATAVLHYAQEVFEGMKAYRHADGSIWTFRPQENALRMQSSCARVSLPELPVELFMQALQALVEIDQDWVPSGGESSLYLRPFMFASEAFLGVRPANAVEFMVIAGPAGSYFASGLKPVSIWLTRDYVRASPGGTGAAKTGGNYAASLAAQSQASEHGCEQVCFLDALEHKWVEELGGMNLFFVYDDGTIVTPELCGTILSGITRNTMVQLAADHGHKIVERRYSVDEWRADAASGRLAEVFACGTAAVVTPVGALVEETGRVETKLGAQEVGPVTGALRSALLDIHYGRAADTHGWLHRLV